MTHYCEVVKGVSGDRTCGKVARFRHPFAASARDYHAGVIFNYCEWLCAECYDEVLAYKAEFDRDNKEARS